MKKFVIVGVAVLLVAGIAGGIFYYNGLKNSSAKASKADLPTAVVERGNLLATISTSGNVVLSEQQKLSFGVAGAIKEVKVVNGSVVKKGDVLAILDAVPFERALAQAQDNLVTAEINLKKTKNPYKESDIISSEAAVLSARNSITSAQKSLDDYMALYTETDLRLAEADVRNARLNLESTLLDQQLNLRVQGTSVRNSYEQELQDASMARENAKKEYTRLIWPQPEDPRTGRKANVYDLSSLIKDTDYHLKLDPKKLGFIAEEAFDKTVEDAYWSWINADISYQKLLLEKKKNEDTLQNNVSKANDAVSKAEQNLAIIKEWPKASEVELRKSQIESAKLALRKSEVSLADIKAGADPLDVTLRENQVGQSKISLEAAQENLEKARLIAPFDGAIFNLTAEVAQQVSGGTTVMQIVNPAKVRIDVSVDEVDISRVREGQEAEITFDALQGMVLAGKVSNVSYVATRTSGVTNFLTSVDLDITRGAQERPARQAGQGSAGASRPGQPPASGQGTGRATQGKQGSSAQNKAGSSSTPGKTGQSSTADKRGAGRPQIEQPSGAPGSGSVARQRPVLRDGMTALVTISTEKREGVLIVPNRAVTSQVRNRIVKVKVGDKVEERTVRTGLTDGSKTEIMNGVEEGDVLVIEPPQVRTSANKLGKSVIPGSKIGF